MNDLIDTRDETFHARRKTGIGGSDVGPIMGVSAWGSALDVWISKRTDNAPGKTETEAMTIGRVIEPTIQRLFEIRTGKTVVPGFFTRSAEHSFMIGHPDGLVMGTREGVEYKNVGAHNVSRFGEDGSDIVPTDYLLQCLHYMVMLDYSVWWLAALLGGNQLRVYRIDRNAELEGMMLRAEAEFWQSVESGVMPKRPRTPEQALALYPIGTKPTIEASAEIVAACQRLRDVNGELARAEIEREDLQAQIMAYMGEHVRLVDISNDVLVTWDNRTSNRIDTKALRSRHPEIALSCTRASTTRYFLLKGARDDN